MVRPPAAGGRPLPLPVIFVGAGEGHAPVVQGYDAETGARTFETAVYGERFRGGVRVAAGDVTGDSYPDVVVAPGPGRGPLLRVLDGKTGGPLSGSLGGFRAFGDDARGGVEVAVADVDGDATPDIVAAARTAGGPVVKVFSGASREVIARFPVAGGAFRDGATVAAADLTRDGKAEVVVGAGGSGRVRAYDPLTGRPLAGPLGAFDAFGEGYRGGVRVGSDALAGDVDGDGTPDLAVGTASGVARVRVFSGATGGVLYDLTPFGPDGAGGARVALAYVDADRHADVVVGTGPGPAAAVKVISGALGVALPGPAGSYAPFGGFTGGVFVAASNDPPTGVVQGRAYYDSDLDGVYDSGETLVASVVVSLMDGATVLATAATDGSGAYAFTVVADGSYTVHFTAPTHYSFSSPTGGNGAATVSGGSTETVEAGLTSTGVRAGGTGSVSGVAYYDSNSNSGRDSGELPVAAVAVKLKDGSTVLATATTDGSGAYSFGGIWPGSYTVEFTAPGGYTFYSPSGGSNSVTVYAGMGSYQDGGLVGTGISTGGDGAVGGKIYYDSNSSGGYDTGEIVVASVGVKLKDGTTVLATATTDAGGEYEFTGIWAGSYTVEFTAPGGYTFYSPSGGSNSVTVYAGMGSYQDGGLVGTGISTGGTGSVAGVVYYDSNASGGYDTGEILVASVGVKLKDGTTVLATATTDGSGAYGFGGIWPGSYTVEFTAPGGYTFYSPSGGSNSVTVYAGSTSTQDGGLVGTGISTGGTGSVSGGVYYDSNSSGSLDVGEIVVSGVGVKLKDGTTVLATATTDGSGAYGFGGIWPGSYTVEFTAPGGYTFYSPSGGSNSVTVYAGSPTAQDAGLVGTGVSIGGTGRVRGVAYFDADESGALNPGEIVLDGITVELRDGATPLATTSTDAYGEYQFADIWPGSFTVHFAAPAGYTFGTPPSGEAPLSIAAGDSLTQDAGLISATAITAVADDTGSAADDRITADDTPTLSGTAGADGAVAIYRRGPAGGPPVSVGTTTAAGGVWSFTSPGPLPDGVYSFTATAGAVPAAHAPPTAVTIDTTPPAVSLAAPSKTYDVRPRVVVTAADLVGFPDPATVTLDADLNNDGDYLDAGEDGVASAPLVGGRATFDAYPALTPGGVTVFRARVTDLAGNTGSGTAAVLVLSSSPPPPAPAITAVDVDTGAADWVTADTTPELSGTAPAGATVSLYAQGPGDSPPVFVASVVASGGGTWSITTPALGDGLYRFTATATASGGTSAPSATVTLLVDSAPPSVAVAAPSPTPLTQPPVTVTASDLVGFAAGATVTLDVDRNLDGDYADADESLGTAPLGATRAAVFAGYAALAAGKTVRFRATVDDLAGNTGTGYALVEVLSPPPPSPPLPPAPVVATLTVDSGASKTDWVTKYNTFAVSGTAVSGATVTLYRQGPGDDDPVLVGSAAESAGEWSVSVTTPLPDDAYTLTATADVSGGTSAASTPVVARVDTAPPGVTVTTPGSPVAAATAPAVTVSASDLVGFAAGATVTLDVDRNLDGDYADADESLGTAPLGATRAAVFAGYAALAAGKTVRFRATVDDLAGNTGTGYALLAVEAPVPVGTLTNLTWADRSGYGGMPGWTTAADALVAAGDVTAAHPLDLDRSPAPAGGRAAALVYHSQEAAPAPVVQVAYRSDNAAGDPTAVTGTLTWDGAVQTLAYDVSDLAPGGDWVFAAAPTAAPTTGRHTYTLALFIDYPGTADDRLASLAADTFVANRSGGPFGAGWSFSGTDTLVTIAQDGAYPPGVLRLFGGGGWAFYADAGGEYLEPTGDVGTLTADAGGWTYTGWDGHVLRFDASGRMTRWASADGTEAVTYTYDGSGKLSTVASPDGGLATFSDSGSDLVVAAPGGRATTITLASSDLTKITDPANGLHTFAYSAHRMTGETYGLGRSAYSYENGLARTVRSGTDPVVTVTAALAAGLGTAAETEVPTGVPGSTRDAAGAETEGWYNRFGQPVQVRAADGGVSTLTRDAAGWVVTTIDPLSRTTAYTVNIRGQVTAEFRHDGTSAAWDYSGPKGSLVAHTDFRGKVWQYGRDASGLLTYVEDPYLRRWAYQWVNGLLESVTDPTSKVVEYLYDAERRPVGALAGVAGKTGTPTGTATYDASGYLVQFADARGNLTTFTNDGLGRPLVVLDPNLGLTTSAYDAAGRVLRTTDPRGNITSYGYDAAGRAEVVVEAHGTALARRTTSAYDQTGRLESVRDALSRRTTFLYDPVGRLRTTVDPSGARTTANYDTAGQLRTVEDALHRVTTYDYDRVGRLEAVTDPLKGVWTTVYDANSNVVATVNPLGHRATVVYDNAGRPVNTIDPEGGITTTNYDYAGRAESFIDPNGNTTHYGYDARGRLHTILDPYAELTTLNYDPDDNLETVTDPNVHTRTWAYDKMGRPEAFIDGEGNRSTTVYDKAGNVWATVDPFGNRTTFQYDALNRPEAVIDPFGKRTTSHYDAGDRVTAQVDRRGNTVTYDYDALDRVTRVTDAAGKSAKFGYDKVGNLTSVRDAMGKVTVYGYDALDRGVTVTDPLGKTSTAAYDKASRLLSAEDANHNVTSYGYDKAGRVRVAVRGFGTADAVPTVYGYDKAGNLTTTTDPNGQVWATEFDKLNRAVKWTDPEDNVTSVALDGVGNVLAATDGRGAEATYAYDKADKPTGTKDAAGNLWTTTYDKTRVLSTEDPRNVVTSFAYFADGALKTKTEAYDTDVERTTAYTYDDNRNLRTVTDPWGNVTTYLYDKRNLRETTIDALGKLWTTVYDAAGRSWYTIDPLNRMATTVYDAAGRVEATIDGLGKRTTAVYDDAGRVAATVDPRGKRTSFVYDHADRRTVVIDANTKRTTTAYDGDRVLSVTDPRGSVTSYAYDDAGRVLTRIEAYGTTIHRDTAYEYDGNGNVVSVTDALNRQTVFGYDDLNRRTYTTDPLTKVSFTGYDEVGNVTNRQDELGHITTVEYDALSRPVVVIDALSNRTTTEYDDTAGRQEVTIDPRNNRTTAVYDKLNRVHVVVDALTNRATTVYDDAGQVWKTIDQLGKTTTYLYDARGLRTGVIDPLNHRTTAEYDAARNVIATVDGLGKRTTFGYDDLNRRVLTIDPRGEFVVEGYDAAGNRTTLIDQELNITTWAYDALNQVKTEWNAGGTAAYDYDAAGQLKAETDRNGRGRAFTYDLTGRKETEAWITAGVTVQLQTWTYDDAGRMLTAQDPDGTYTMGYDDANRVLWVDGPWGLSLTFGYDKAGNRDRVEDSKGGVTTVTFDALNRQSSERVGGTGVTPVRFDHAYTKRGEVESVTRYSDLAGTAVVATTAYQYYDDGALKNLRHTSGAGAGLANYTYTYDAAHRLTEKVENGAGTTYGYDDARQLTSDGAATYGYDGTGNRTNAGYATGAGNRLTTDGTWTYTHDAEGNLTKKSKGASAETWVYTYDHRNQMVSATKSATDGGAATARATYSYDAWGNNIQRQAWDGAATTTARYGTDGWDPKKRGAQGTERFDTWADLDGSNAVTDRRAFGPGYDEVVARQAAGGAVNYYLGDHQGSVRLLVDNSATVLATATYSAFGVLTGVIGDRYGFTGQEHDGLTAMIDMEARWVLPDVARFTSEDPKGFAAGDQNLFRYVGNSPTNATDPSGMDDLHLTSDDWARWKVYRPTWTGVDERYYWPIGRVNKDKGTVRLTMGALVTVEGLEKFIKQHDVGRLDDPEKESARIAQLLEEKYGATRDAVRRGLEPEAPAPQPAPAPASSFQTTSGRQAVVTATGQPIPVHAGPNGRPDLAESSVVRFTTQYAGRNPTKEVLNVVYAPYFAVIETPRYFIEPVAFAADTVIAGGYAVAGSDRNWYLSGGMANLARTDMSGRAIAGTVLTETVIAGTTYGPGLLLKNIRRGNILAEGRLTIPPATLNSSPYPYSSGSYYGGSGCPPVLAFDNPGTMRMVGVGDPIIWSPARTVEWYTPQTVFSALPESPIRPQIGEAIPLGATITSLTFAPSAGSSAASNSRPMFSADWQQLLASRYGTENVEWMTSPTNQLWRQTWRESVRLQGSGGLPNATSVVEGAVHVETGTVVVRPSGGPGSLTGLQRLDILDLPNPQREFYPSGVCGMPQAVRGLAESFGGHLPEGTILVTRGGFQYSQTEAAWYFMTPCRNCVGIMELNPFLRASPLPRGVQFPPGVGEGNLPTRRAFPFNPAEGP